ncbi:MAG: HEAT repeat domain-containing protein [Planctomycetaceae bacterium]|nr:HEAT repeat domain-containing protein [Planctomycetaceae bacterium]
MKPLRQVWLATACAAITLVAQGRADLPTGEPASRAASSRSAGSRPADEITRRRVQALIKDLDSKTPLQCLQAATDLGEYGSHARSAVLPLARKLTDSECSGAAARSLAYILSVGGPLEAQSRAQLMETVLGGSKDALAGYLAYVSDTCPEGDSDFPALVAAHLHDPDRNVRLACVTACRRLGQAARFSRPALVVLLDDPDDYVRDAALEAIENLGPAPDLIGVLRKLLKTESQQALALKMIDDLGPGARAALPELVDVLAHNNDSDLRRPAGAILRKLAGESFEAVFKAMVAMKDTNDEIDALLIWHSDDPAVQQSLTAAALKYLQHPQPLIRKQALRALKGNYSPSAIEPVAKTLTDADPWVRVLGAEVLARFAAGLADQPIPKTLAEALTAASQSPDRAVRAAAVAFPEGPLNDFALNLCIKAAADHALEPEPPESPGQDDPPKDKPESPKRVSLAALETLAKLAPTQPPAARAVQTALLCPDPAVRADVVDVLIRRGEAEMRNALLAKSLADPSSAVRGAAVQAYLYWIDNVQRMTPWHARRMAPLILDESLSTELRCALIQGLGNRRGARPFLTAAAGSADGEVRSMALMAMQVPDPIAILLAASAQGRSIAIDLAHGSLPSVSYAIISPFLPSFPSDDAPAKPTGTPAQVAGWIVENLFSESGSTVRKARAILLGMSDQELQIALRMLGERLGQDGAAEALIMLGPASIPVLTKALDTVQKDARRQAAFALSIVDPDNARGVLCLAQMVQQDHDAQALTLLGKLGVRAAPATAVLLNAAQDDSPTFAALAVNVLARAAADDPAVKAALRDALSDSRLSVRKEAVNAAHATALQDPAAVRLLVQKLYDEDPDVVRRAIYALCDAKLTAELRNDLTTFLSRQHRPEIRFHAARALFRTDPKSRLLTQELLAAAENTSGIYSSGASSEAFAALADKKPHPDLVLPVLRRMKEGGDERAAYVLAAYEPVTTERVVASTFARFGSLRMWLREDPNDVLTRAGDDAKILAAIVEGLRDADSETGMAIAEALSSGKFKADYAAAHLRAMLLREDFPPDHRIVYGLALHRITPADATPLRKIVEIMQDPWCHRRTTHRALSILADMGPAAQPALEAIKKLPTSGMVTAWAILRIDTRDRLGRALLLREFDRRANERPALALARILGPRADIAGEKIKALTHRRDLGTMAGLTLASVQPDNAEAVIAALDFFIRSIATDSYDIHSDFVRWGESEGSLANRIYKETNAQVMAWRTLSGERAGDVILPAAIKVRSKLAAQISSQKQAASRPAPASRGQ